MTIYSHSRLAAYETCPLQYKFRYIQKPDIVKQQGIEAFVGTRFHETMEKLYGDLKFNQLNKKEDLFAYYDQIWQENYTEDILIVSKERTFRDYQNMGRHCIDSYYDRYYPFNQSRTLGIETKIEINLDDAGKYRVQGYIDRLTQDNEGVYEIHDYKTSGTLPTQKKLDSDRQLALYHEGLRQNFSDVEEVRLIWHYVVFDKSMVSGRSISQLERLKKETITLIDKIEETEEFLPCESALCNWCDYISICPLKKHQCAVSKLPVNKFSNEEGVKLVNILDEFESEKKVLKNHIATIEKEVSLVKEALLQYAEKENIQVVVGRDKQVKISNKIKIEIPKKGTKAWGLLEEKLKKINKLENLKMLDTSALKKAIKDNLFTPEQLSEIEGVYTCCEQKHLSLSKLKK